MNAQTKCGILLVIEFLAGLFGYHYGSTESLTSSILELIPIVVLPIFASTFFFFMAASCGLNSQGKLRSDTIFYKLISRINPKVNEQGEVHLCPSHAWMAVLAAIICAVTAL